MTVRTPIREGLGQAIDAIVNQTAKTYSEKTGKPMDAKALLFVKAMVDSMIELVTEAVAAGGNVNMRQVAKLATSRALAAAGFMVDEKSMNECVLATVSLAAATQQTFGIMVGAAGMSASGAGAIVGVPVLVASGFFYALEVGEMAETCGEAYVKHVEKQFEASHRVSSQRSMRLNYSNMVCAVPLP
jgi:hypothetical protein